MIGTSRDGADQSFPSAPVVAYGRRSPCPLCLTTVGEPCRSESGGLASKDHRSRWMGAGPDFPARKVHIDHPRCECQSCLKEQARQRRAARTAQRELDRQQQAALAAEQERLASLITSGGSFGNGARAVMSVQDRLKAPCYVCEAGIGQRCIKANSVPHLARGSWGAWKIRRGSDDASIIRRYRAMPAPAGKLVATQQEGLLNPGVASPLPRIPSQRTPVMRRPAAAPGR